MSCSHRVPIDYGPVPAHAWSFLELGSAPLAIDHFVWLSHKHGTVFLPTSLHQLLYRLSRDNLKYFYLPNLSHHFKLLSHIFVPCLRSYLAYTMLISTFYYYYCYYYYYYYYNMTSVNSKYHRHQRLSTSPQCRSTERSTICQSTTAGSTPLQTFARRAFAVVWNLLPDYLSDPAVDRDTFRKHLKTFLLHFTNLLTFYLFTSSLIFRSLVPEENFCSLTKQRPYFSGQTR